jgi:CxxC-x17-CxxC domain-containing protein
MDNIEFSDKEIACRDCKKTFLFSAAEQQFFKEKGLGNEPKRCANCRLVLRNQRLGLSPEQTAEVGCSICNQPTRVPFQPNGHKPVLCNVCFHTRKDNAPVPENRDRELALV